MPNRLVCGLTKKGYHHRTSGDKKRMAARLLKLWMRVLPLLHRALVLKADSFPTIVLPQSQLQLLQNKTYQADAFVKSIDLSEAFHLDDQGS